MPVSTHSANKRPLPISPSAPSPSNLPPLAQRIRSDIKVGECEVECEVESTEQEILRSSPSPENSLSHISPCAKRIPAPAPLVFTPVYQKVTSCLNCEAEMTADHQCEKGDPSVTSNALWESFNGRCNIRISLRIFNFAFHFFRVQIFQIDLQA